MANELTEASLEALFKDAVVKVAHAIREARAGKQARMKFDMSGYPSGVVTRMVLDLLCDQQFVAFGVLPGGRSVGVIEHILVDLTRMRPKKET